MVQGLYDFWLKELADYYIEVLKPVMKGDDEEAKKAAMNTLYICLDSGLRMLHPTMPYLTEELYQRLPHRIGEVPESICIAPFPEELISFEAEGVESSVDLLQQIISKLRSQFAQLNIPKSANPEVYIRISDDATKKIFESETGIIQSLVKSGDTIVLGAAEADPAGCLKAYLNENISLYVKVVGLIDINLEIERVEKRNAQLVGFKEALEKKMLMKGYELKTPENIRQQNTEKVNLYLAELNDNLKSISELQTLK